MVIEYDPSVAYLQMARRFSHSVAPDVLCRFEVWFWALEHIAVNMAFRRGVLKSAQREDNWLYVDRNNLKIVGSMTLLFQVFYLMQAYKRYRNFHKATTDILGLLTDYSTLACVHLRRNSPIYCRLAVRYACAGTLLVFLNLTPEGDDEDWTILRRNRLVLPAERAYLDRFSVLDQATILLHWSALAARDGYFKAKAPEWGMTYLTGSVGHLRMIGWDVAELMKVPIPFQYFHLLNLMVVLNMTLSAYGTAITCSLWAPIYFFGMGFIMLGMMELAAQLADPFGKDEIDFNLSHWLTMTFRDCLNLLEAPLPAWAACGWQEALEAEGPLLSKYHANVLEHYMNSKVVEQYHSQRTETRPAVGGVRCCSLQRQPGLEHQLVTPFPPKLEL